MNQVAENLKIENLIYEIRGKQVIMDAHVVKLFGYETKYLNRQVQRNIERFPKDYCFQLTEEEYENLRCQFGTSNINNYGEEDIFLTYLLSMELQCLQALKSEIAVAMSLKIVDAFVAMRRFIANILREAKKSIIILIII